MRGINKICGWRKSPQSLNGEGKVLLSPLRRRKGCVVMGTEEVLGKCGHGAHRLEGKQKEHLKKLLRELKGGEVDAKTKEKAKEFFSQVDATTLGLLEQELIAEGVSHDEIRGSLCDLHLDVMKDSLVSQKKEVASPHPIHTLMEEHKVILSILSELKSLLTNVKKAKGFGDIAGDLDGLEDAAHHLVEAEKHHKREEDVLFPMLEKHGVTEPPNVMKMDHAEFMPRKQKLYKFVSNHKDYGFEQFKKEVIEAGDYLTRGLEDHIFKEDNILYQIALEVISDEEWKEVKRGCDKIGYCCFTPADIT